MPALAKSWSPDEVRALQAEDSTWRRYELIDGELIMTNSPSVRHQTMVLELTFLIRGYLGMHGLGSVLNSPADIALDAYSIVQPDIFVTPAALAVKKWTDVTSLLLAVEVLSPSTARYDRVVKRRFFQSHGVPEYWVVDIDARVVERWRPIDDRPDIASESLQWQPDARIVPLTIDLVALFAAASR